MSVSSYFLPSHAFSLLRVEDEDRFSFLQGQWTNDLHRTENGPDYGLFLDTKGKIEADGWILQHADHFLLYSPATPPAVLLARLDRVLIADEVVLTAVQDDYRVVLVDQAPASLPENAYLFPSRQGPAGFHDVVLPASAVPAFLASLTNAGAREMPASSFQSARLTTGVPLVPAEISPRLLPPEAGFDAFISYTKGCYLGQEVIARFKNFGVLRRQTGALRWAETLPQLPAPLYNKEGKGVGEILSAFSHPAHQWIGMAWFPRSATELFLDPAANQPAFPL